MQVIDTSQNLAVFAMRSDMLALLQRQAGKPLQLLRMQQRYLEMYNAGPSSVRDCALGLLSTGRIRQATGVTPAAYYAPSPGQLSTELANAQLAKPWRPLKRGIGMYENINRAKEAREQYKSIG